jgi:hypothetical protein
LLLTLFLTMLKDRYGLLEMGAVGPDGKAWTTPEGVRNTAMTMYKISMLSEGFKGRPK